MLYDLTTCDETGRAIAEGEARRRAAATMRLAAPHDPAAVARQITALLERADLLAERDLATPAAEVQAALAALGRSGAMARLFTHARRAYHLAEAAKLERALQAEKPAPKQGGPT
jgi:hypothetical protein